MFTFFVGPGKKPIVVHSATLTAQSSVFNTLINGGIRGAQSRSAEIEDTEADDFVRLCEFAYRGDYSTPVYEISEKESDDSQNMIGSRNPHAGYGGLREVDQTLYIKEEAPKEERLLKSRSDRVDADWPVAVQEEVSTEVYYDGWNSKKSRKEPDRVVLRPAISKAAKFRERFDCKCFCKDGFPRDPIIASFETSNSSSKMA